MQSFLRKISVSPSILLGLVVIFLALVLQGLGEPCTQPCNTTSSSSISTSCGSDCSAIEPPGSLARRPPARRPPPPVRRPPPPVRRPPPPPVRRPPPPVRRPPPPPTRRPPPPPVRRPPPPPVRRPPPPPVRRPPPPPVRRPPPPPIRRPPPPPTPRPSPPPTPPGPEPPTPPTPLTEIITEELFNEFLLDRIYPSCPGRWFYNYHAFITAAEAFPAFGNVGNEETRKREIAAFFGQTSHETAGGVIAHDGPFTWGYCYIAEVGPWMPEYCDFNSGWPCVPGRSYYGRGPVQLRWNYNYGKAGEALGMDLLEDPDLVAHDEVISFETAIWFWMTPQDNKPSSHQVITGQWMPNLEDLASNRMPGYGVITNIFNGRSECGRLVPDNREEGRIQLYKRYCDMLGVSYGDNLSCFLQYPFDGYPFKFNREDNNATLALSTTNKQGHLEPVESA